MKLYLEQFNIPCCVLNSELPVATRLHTVSFHSNIYFHFTYLHAHHLTGTRLHVQIASFLSFEHLICTLSDCCLPSRWNSSTKVFTM